MALLEVSSISKAFGSNRVLRDVSFAVKEGEIVCLLGPSGCGKTTLLRIIAGLEKADLGQMKFDGQPLDQVPVHHRGFGLMFQDYALFPHKDVAANVSFGLLVQSLHNWQVEARVAEMLDLVGLAGYERRRVYELSGGEQQRVALARSLAPGPRLLMLDEPLGSLDRALREELMNELRAILKRVGVTSIYVTHDQQEAFAVADRVFIMDRGQIVQQGTPQEVYRYPVSAWVARFLGLANLIPGRVLSLEPLQVSTSLGELKLGSPRDAPSAKQPFPGTKPLAAGQEVTLLIRPEAARSAVECSEEGELRIEGVLGEYSFRGGYYRLVIHSNAGLDLVFEVVSDGSDLPGTGQPITLALRAEAISLLPGVREERATVKG